jgi:hypothetical protein
MTFEFTTRTPALFFTVEENIFKFSKRATHGAMTHDRRLGC